MNAQDYAKARRQQVVGSAIRAFTVTMWIVVLIAFGAAVGQIAHANAEPLDRCTHQEHSHSEPHSKPKEHHKPSSGGSHRSAPAKPHSGKPKDEHKHSGHEMCGDSHELEHAGHDAKHAEHDFHRDEVGPHRDPHPILHKLF